VTRSIDHYNLDAIISVGYRVNSVRATQFRQWGTSVLRDFAIRGYVIDRQRLEQPSQAAWHKRRAQVSESTK
jgi:toxin-antitoxin system, toxin component, fic family